VVSEGFRGEGACCAIKVQKGWESAVPELFGAMGGRGSRRVQRGGGPRFQKGSEGRGSAVPESLRNTASKS
jgi:hypothetical protein